MILKSKTFWISTVLFLIVAGALLWKVYPPLLRQHREQTAEINSLAKEIQKHQEYLANLQTLQKQKTELDKVYAAARLALPTTPDTENLIIQLDALASSLKLGNVSINVPLSTSDNKSSNNSRTFTLRGTASYDTSLKLLTQLKNLSRWNKVTLLEISQLDGANSVTITGEAYFKPNPPKDFSGQNTSFLPKAISLFQKYQGLGTVPDITKEGNFGRTNPFGTAQ